MKMFCNNKSSELVHDKGKSGLFDKENILFFVVGIVPTIVTLIKLIISTVIIDANYMVNMAEYPSRNAIILSFLMIAIQAFFGIAIYYRELWAALTVLVLRVFVLVALIICLLIDFPVVVALIFSTRFSLQIELAFQIPMIVLTSILVKKLFKSYVPSNKIITYERDHRMFSITGLLYILGDLILGIIPVIIAVLPHIQYILDLLFKADVFKTENGIDEFIRVIGLYKTEIIISIIYLFIRLFFGIGIIIKKRWAVLTVRIFMIIGFFSNFLIFLLRIGNINSWIDLLPLISVLLYIAYNIVMIVFTSNIARIFEYDVQNYRRRIRDRCQ